MLNVDDSNHPLAHLMQSVFGLHDRSRVRVFLYSTSPWDGSSYRPRISGDVEVFVDAATWSSEDIVKHIVQHQIHVRKSCLLFPVASWRLLITLTAPVINLGGYTKGARNDVFAVRPCPVQMQLMGYAGTLGAGTARPSRCSCRREPHVACVSDWCDYLVSDPIACPQETCASELWRIRRRDGRVANEDHRLDLHADLDPEENTDEWVL